jgi:hypothetical protein
MITINGICYDDTHGMREVVPRGITRVPVNPVTPLRTFRMDVAQKMAELGLPTSHLARPAETYDPSGRYSMLIAAGVEL